MAVGFWNFDAGNGASVLGLSALLRVGMKCDIMFGVDWIVVFHVTILRVSKSFALVGPRWWFW